MSLTPINIILRRKSGFKKVKLRLSLNLSVPLHKIILKPPHQCVCSGCIRSRRLEINRYRKIHGLEPEPKENLPIFKNCQCEKCIKKRENARRFRFNGKNLAQQTFFRKFNIA